MHFEKVELWEGREDVYLQTYLAEFDPLLPAPEQELPAIIVCPGGAYMFFSQKGEGDAVAMNFAAAGYQVFMLKYTTGSDCGGRPGQYPTQLLDFGKAIMIIRENAKKWHVDVGRMGICGFSAGAHLCATLATRWQEPTLSEYFKVEPETFRPAFAILGYPLTDYVFQEEYNATQPANPMLQMSNQFYFGTLHPTEEQLKDQSPMLHVTENTPPIFLAHASNDTMVPVEHSLRMATALREKGRPFELHIFRYGEHGFNVGTDILKSEYRIDCYKACHEWINLALKWALQIICPETQEHDVTAAELMGDGAFATPPESFDGGFEMP